MRNIFRRRRPARSTCPCADCATPTAPIDGPSEWYAVSDTVWESAGATPDAILCIGCLEDRLGRRLSRQDFPEALLNRPDYGWHSDRLVDRLKGGSEPP